jgi:hypothetical protein
MLRIGAAGAWDLRVVYWTADLSPLEIPDRPSGLKSLYSEPKSLF